MIAIAIGTLRHRLVLEQAVRTPDGGGGADETWQFASEVWAAIHPLGGSERVAGDRVSGALSHEIVVRFGIAAEPSMRFRLGARVFEVIAVRDVDERRRHLRCLCMERDL